MTRETVQGHLSKLKGELDAAMAGVYRVQGAILLAERLLKDMDAPPEAPKE